MASPELSDPVDVEPTVNLEKLRDLLALQSDYATLDFKKQCLRRRRTGLNSRSARLWHEGVYASNR
jgi:hypothetical protein